MEDLGNKFLVSIKKNKNDYPGQFIIGQLFYSKVKKYISLRPEGEFSDSFFIHYGKGNCTRQNIGRHTIGGIPKEIATFLGLKNPERYTGHCFRRTAATLLSESGASSQMIRQLGRWRSDIIAQGYIEDSLHNRQAIYQGLIHEQNRANIQPANIVVVSSLPTTPVTHAIASTSQNMLSNRPEKSTIYPRTSAGTEKNSNSYIIDDADFYEDFTLNQVNSALSKSSNILIFLFKLK